MASGKVGGDGVIVVSIFAMWNECFVSVDRNDERI